MLEWVRPLLETCSHISAPQFPGCSSLFPRTNETDGKDWLVCLCCHFLAFFLTVRLELVCPRIIPPWPPQHQRGRAAFEPTEAELAHSQQPDICLGGFHTFSCVSWCSCSCCTAQLWEPLKKVNKVSVPKVWLLKDSHSITVHHNLSLNLHREDIDSPHPPPPPFFLHGWSTFWEKCCQWTTLWPIGCYNPVLKGRERS